MHSSNFAKNWTWLFYAWTPQLKWTVYFRLSIFPCLSNKIEITIQRTNPFKYVVKYLRSFEPISVLNKKRCLKSTYAQILLVDLFLKLCNCPNILFILLLKILDIRDNSILFLTPSVNGFTMVRGKSHYRIKSPTVMLDAENYEIKNITRIKWNWSSFVRHFLEPILVDHDFVSCVLILYSRVFLIELHNKRQPLLTHTTN